MSNVTLSELVYKTIRELGVLTESTATGGSTTTILDSNFRTEANDYWNGGIAFVVYDAGGAAAAPQGDYRRISDFAVSGGTITVSAAFSSSSSVAAGDRYAIARKPPGENANWSEIVIQNINRALQDLGPLPITDVTTITTAADQTEYNLPLAAKQDLRQVWIQTLTSDTTDRNLWERLMPGQYYVQSSVAGTQDKLVFKQQPPYAYALKLVYVADHSELNAATDQLNEFVPVQRVICPAVRDTFRWMRQATQWDRWDLDIARWEERAELATIRYPIRYPKKDSRFMILDDNFVYTDEPNKVYV